MLKDKLSYLTYHFPLVNVITFINLIVLAQVSQLNLFWIIFSWIHCFYFFSYERLLQISISILRMESYNFVNIWCAICLDAK